MAMDPVPPPAPEAPGARPDALARLRAEVGRLRAALQAPAPAPGEDPSAVHRQLEELLGSARALPEAPAETSQLLILLGRLECRRGNLARARDLMSEGLAMQAAPSAGAAQLARDHYFLACVARDLRSFAAAAEHFARAAKLAADTADFNLEQRLGMRERQAHALHEAQRYVEAYAINRAILDEGERAFGSHDPRLSTVLINAAQNLYAMRRLVEAEALLRQALAIAEARSQKELEQDLLYQLAVLAGEQGKRAEARARLAARVERLQALGPSKLLDGARQALEHFDRHQARARG